MENTATTQRFMLTENGIYEEKHSLTDEPNSEESRSQKAAALDMFHMC